MVWCGLLCEVMFTYKCTAYVRSCILNVHEVVHVCMHAYVRVCVHVYVHMSVYVFCVLTHLDYRIQP